MNIDSLVPDNEKKSFYGSLSNNALKKLRDNDPSYIRDMTPSQLKYLSSKISNNRSNSTQNLPPKPSNGGIGSDLLKFANFVGNPLSGSGNFIRHAGADVANAGQDIVNLIGSPFGYKNTIDNYKTFGVNPNAYDSVASAILPFIAGGPVGEAGAALGAARLGLGKAATAGAKLLGYGAAGGATSEPDTPVQGALEGAVGSGLGAGSGKLLSLGINKLSPPALRLLGNIGKSSLSRKLSANLINSSESIPSYGESAQNSYNNAMDSFLKNNERAKKLASDLDSHYSDNNMRINPSKYTNYLSSFIGDVNKLTPIQQQPFNTAKDFAIHQIDNKQIPTNFTDSVQLHRNLNQSLSDFINQNNKTPNDVNALKLISGLKGNIRDSMLNHGGDIGDLRNALMKANKSYGDAQNVAKLPNTYNSLVKNKSLLESLKSGDIPKDSLFNKFITKNPQGLKQISKTLNVDPNDLSRKMIANDIADINGNLNISGILKKYDNLSPSQRSSIFTKENIESIEALKAGKNKDGSSMPLKGVIRGFGIPATTAALGYEKHGAFGAILGAGAGIAANAVISKVLSKPKVISWLLKEKLNKQVGEFKKSSKLGALSLGGLSSNGNE